MIRRSSIARRDISGFIVLAVFLLLGYIALSSSNNQPPDVVAIEQWPDPSIENTRSSGSRGLFEWTEKLGYRPDVWRQSYLSLPDDAQVLFCIAPNLTPPRALSMGQATNTLTASEGRSLREWISRGHTFILFASSLPRDAASDGNDYDDDSPKSSFAGQIGIGMEHRLRETDEREDYSPLQPSKWTDGIAAIHVYPGYRVYRQSDDGIVLFGSVIADASRAGDRYQEEPVAVTYPIGRGRVIAVSDDLFGSNSNLLRAGNAAFIDRMLALTAKPGARILFDEYHRQFGGSAPGLWPALGAPAQMAFVQLALAALIALLVLAPRLGRTEPLTENNERTSAEYITSLAALYRSARASGAALETVYRQFLREVCQKFGLPPGVSLEKLSETAARRGGVRADDLKRCLIACERALENHARPSDHDLVVLVRAIERFRKDLGIG